MILSEQIKIVLYVIQYILIIKYVKLFVLCKKRLHIKTAIVVITHVNTSVLKLKIRDTAPQNGSKAFIFLSLHAEQDKISQGRRAQASLDLSYLRSYFFLDTFVLDDDAEKGFCTKPLVGLY